MGKGEDRKRKAVDPLYLFFLSRKKRRNVQNVVAYPCHFASQLGLWHRYDLKMMVSTGWLGGNVSLIRDLIQLACAMRQCQPQTQRVSVHSQTAAAKYSNIDMSSASVTLRAKGVCPT